MGPPRRAVSWERLVPWGVLGAVGVAYASSFWGAFIYDDLHTLALACGRQGRRLWGVLPLTSRPLTDLTFVMQGVLSGTRSADYHLFNLGCHLANVAMVWAVVRRWLASFAGEDQALAIAAGTALLWGCHPVTTSAVTYITQRYEVMASSFYLFTVYAALQSAAPKSGRFGWSLVAVLSSWAAMASKEIALTVPLAVLLMDRMSDAQSTWRSLFRRRGPLYAGLVFGWVILAGLMALKTRQIGSRHYVGAEVSPWVYAATQTRALGQYLRLVFWPSVLCFDYGWPLRVEGWTFLGWGAAVGGLLALTVVGICRRDVRTLPSAWFFLLLAPTSSFLPRPDPIVEHRVYLAAAGPIGGAVALLWALTARCGLRSVRRGRQTGRGVTYAALVIALGVLAGWRTWRRHADYTDDVTLWQATVRCCPKNLRARVALGSALLVRGRNEEAIRTLEEALHMARQMDGRHYAYWTTVLGMLHNNLGVLHYRAGRYDQAAAHFREALAWSPHAEDAAANLRQALRKLPSNHHSSADSVWSVPTSPP